MRMNMRKKVKMLNWLGHDWNLAIMHGDSVLGKNEKMKINTKLLDDTGWRRIRILRTAST